MAFYLSLPILDAIVQLAENDSNNDASVKAMAFGILNYYFPVANGHAVLPKQHRNNNYVGFIIRRIQRRFPGDRSLIDHTFAEAKGAGDDLEASLDQLKNALENANTEFGRCWVIIIHGVNFKFYEYHPNLPKGLIPWGPPNQCQPRNSFHARNDSVEVDWMLRHMARNDTPPAQEHIS